MVFVCELWTQWKYSSKGGKNIKTVLKNVDDLWITAGEYSPAAPPAGAGREAAAGGEQEAFYF